MNFEEKYHYYDAVLNEHALQDYYPYLRTHNIKRDKNFLINYMKINHKYKYQEHLDKIEKVNEVSSSSKTKYLLIDRLVLHNHYIKEMRELKLFLQLYSVQGTLYEGNWQKGSENTDTITKSQELKIFS